jgi:hypothetical protein
MLRLSWDSWGKIKIVDWVSKSIGVGAQLRSSFDDLHAAYGGISGHRSLGLSLTDQIDALLPSIIEPVVTLFKDNCLIKPQYDVFISHRATDLLNCLQWNRSDSINSDLFNPLQDRDGALIIDADCSLPLICQAKTARWSENDIQHSWVNLARLRWERDWFRNASSNVRSWVAYLDDYVSRIWYDREDSWTREFLNLDPNVLDKDDWTLTFQYREFSDPEVIPLIRGYLPDFGEHFKKVSDLLQDLRQLLVKVEEIKNHFDWLCQLGASLLVFFYRCCSLFLSQRSWFLHHSAHPPHARTSYLPGFGGAGALLQLSS